VNGLRVTITITTAIQNYRILSFRGISSNSVNIRGNMEIPRQRPNSAARLEIPRPAENWSLRMSMSRKSTSLKKSSGDCLKLAKQRYSILSEMVLFLNYYIFSGSAEALIRCGGKQYHLLIAYFIGNTCARYYENQTMLSRVTATKVGKVFLRHTAL